MVPPIPIEPDLPSARTPSHSREVAPAFAHERVLITAMAAAQQLARLCENSGLWGASPKNGIEGSKKWGRTACAPQALGVEVGTRLANSGFSHRLSLQLTRLAGGKLEGDLPAKMRENE